MTNRLRFAEIAHVSSNRENPPSHILVVTGAYAPDCTGIAPLETELCEMMAARGHRVSVVTGLPHYPEWRVPAEYHGKLWMRECRGGVAVHRAAIYVPGRRTTFRRILFDTSIGMATALRGLPIPRVDLVLAVSPPLQAALAGSLLAVKNRAPLALHLQDLLPDLAVALGMLRNHAAIRLAQALEKSLYRRASAIFVISEGFRANLLAKGVPEGKVKVTPNWIDTAAIGPHATAGDFRRRHGISENDFLALHTGNMGAKQKLDTVLEAAAILREDASVVFCLVGGGTEKARLQELAASRGLANVKFLPLEPKELLAPMLASANVLLVHQSAHVVDMVVPSKLITYMAAGRAVVAAADRKSEAAQAILRAACGLLVPPEDPGALAAALARLQSNPGLAAHFGNAGRRYAEQNFNRDLLLTRFENELVRLIEERKNPEPEPSDLATLPTTAGQIRK